MTEDEDVKHVRRGRTDDKTAERDELELHPKGGNESLEARELAIEVGEGWRLCGGDSVRDVERGVAGDADD